MKNIDIASAAIAFVLVIILVLLSYVFFVRPNPYLEQQSIIQSTTGDNSPALMQAGNGGAVVIQSGRGGLIIQSSEDMKCERTADGCMTCRGAGVFQQVCGK